MIRSVEPDYVLAVSIDIETDSPGRILIEDNAGGIHRSDFDRAFKAAEVPPDRTGLSEFGMGMKSASIWFANNWSVETTSIGDGLIYTVEFDMQLVLSGAMTELTISAVPGDASDHFTRIRLWNLNQNPRGRTLGKIRDHLRDIYRTYLRSGELRLVVSNERMAYLEPRVLEAADVRADQDGSGELVRWQKPIDIRLESGATVSGFAGIREEGSTRDAGFALLRRGRVIVGSGDTPYRPTAVFGGGNSFRSQRLFGELNVDGLAVSHTKDGFQWGESEEEFLEKLREELDAEPLPLLKQAENFRSRTITRQQAKMISDATDSTARSIEAELPSFIEEVLVNATGGGDVLLDSPPDLSHGISRVVAFHLDGQEWEVTVASIQDANSARWLTRRISDRTGKVMRIDVTLNAAHPFVSQFALGDKDSFEAVLRIAVALVVAESLINDAGLPFAAALLRHVDSVLTKALSGRVTR